MFGNGLTASDIFIVLPVILIGLPLVIGALLTNDRLPLSNEVRWIMLVPLVCVVYLVMVQTAAWFGIPLMCIYIYYIFRYFRFHPWLEATFYHPTALSAVLNKSSLDHCSEYLSVLRSSNQFPSPYCDLIADAFTHYYQQDKVIWMVPDLPSFELCPNKQQYRQIIDNLLKVIQGPEPKQIADAYREAATAFVHLVETRFPLKHDGSPFSVPITDLMSDTGYLIAAISELFWSTSFQDLKIGREFRDKYRINRQVASARSLSQKQIDEGIYISPHAYPGTPAETAHVYLMGTPFLALFQQQVPFDFEQHRSTHQWVVAPSGTGKTQLLQSQIIQDLTKVEAGEASIVVIDSQNKLVPTLARLKLFAEGQPLHGKLVLLEPDPDHPLALNLFDMGQAQPNLSARDREMLSNSTQEMTEFCLNSLLGAEMTSKQSVLFTYVIQLLMTIPNATIDTFRKLMLPHGLSDYRPYLSKLDETVRDFFEHQFDSPQFTRTKEEVVWRLMAMLKDPTFRRMFQSPRNKFSMFDEINAGKVICINTDLALLKKDRTETFGRFFIALLMQATEQRAMLQKPLPVYCYIDECHDYIAADENIATLLDKARKQNVAFIFAHQRLANIKSANVLDALSNVSIKFAGGNHTDASTLAKIMRTTPDFITTQPKLSFAAFVHDQTPQAIQLRVTYGVMENMDAMTAEEQNAIKVAMHDRYCYTPNTEPPPPDETPGDTSPSTKWGK